MKNFLRLSAVSAIALLSLVGPARADVNVWRDLHTKMSVSYDDSWQRISNQKPDDVLTLRAPAGYGFAECKVNVADEGRFKIYPTGLSGPVQRLHVSENFWDQYLAQYDHVDIYEGTDNNGLGRGFASMAFVSYDTVMGAKMRKRAIGFASYYRNHIYTVECSAQEGVYAQWHDRFLSFIKSVDFDEGSDSTLNGYYRDFLSDKTLKVRGPHVFEDTYH